MTAPDDELNPGSTVSFSVKELFDKLDGKLDKIDGKLDHKVDRAEFIDWTSRHEQADADHERRIGDLEVAEAGRRGVSAWQAKTWVALGGLGAVAAAIAGLAVALVH